MILLVALVAGVLIGVVVARGQRRPWGVPLLRSPWLVIVGFLPQFFAIYLPVTRLHISDGLAGASVIVSQCLLLLFCWLNRRAAGIWLLALGTACNLLVIAANGGFMPISPQTVGRLVTPQVAATLEAGSRFGWKDILLPTEQTRLAFLSDRFLLPEGFFYQVAFSFGDMLIAAGAFWLAAFSIPSPKSSPIEVMQC